MISSQDIQRQLIEATRAFQMYRLKVDKLLISKGYAPLYSGSREIDIVRRYWMLAAEPGQAATHVQLARDIR